MSRRSSVLDRFWAKVAKLGGLECWLWMAAKSKGGYGNFKSGPRYVGAHVYSYTLAHGIIPDGLQVNHKCGTRACVNPNHLYAGTVAQNNHDQDTDGTRVHGQRHYLSKITHAQAAEIRADSRVYREIGVAYGITASNVCYIKSGRTWTRPEFNAGGTPHTDEEISRVRDLLERERVSYTPEEQK